MSIQPPSFSPRHGFSNSPWRTTAGFSARSDRESFVTRIRHERPRLRLDPEARLTAGPPESTDAGLARGLGRPLFDLVGKGGHIRTVPVPDWVRTELEDWLAAAAIDRGKLFRRVNKV
jgi:hypothetical protein